MVTDGGLTEDDLGLHCKPYWWWFIFVVRRNLQRFVRWLWLRFRITENIHHLLNVVAIVAAAKGH
ncbi:hypothetical protein HanRHA438_Chr01g0031981 [Helianthus annuus]|uniref:Uncharacterized protein n=1 Tax=Helianthus annuus TaxID=4232 RepID=A0A251VR15_HELAN|nr:hypothetical protein HanHA89_Chr01g0027581 [Helianthus annuus]KAJ0948822.1 hypothetical protein HanRHA438_Chr01g0031981 [Helianthus annuus]